MTYSMHAIDPADTSNLVDISTHTDFNDWLSFGEVSDQLELKSNSPASNHPLNERWEVLDSSSSFDINFVLRATATDGTTTQEFERPLKGIF